MAYSEYDATIAYDYNGTEYVTLEPDDLEWEDGLQRAIATIYCLLFLLGFLGNVLVLLVLGGCCRSSKRGRLIDTLVRHLAAADLVFVATLPLWAASAADHHRWDFGEVLCRLSSFVVAVNRFATVAFLACMSADRYLAIVKQLDACLLQRDRRVRICCALVWVLALALGSPALFFRHVNTFSMCVDPEDSSWFQVYSLLTVLLGFVLPVTIMLLCYGAICLHLQRNSGQVYAHMNGSSKSNNGGAAYNHPRARARRRHTLKMVFAIVTAFIVSWMPFSLCRGLLAGAGLAQVGVEVGWVESLRHALLLSSCLAFVNSSANPAIYLLLDRHFRRRAGRLAKGCLRIGGISSSMQDSLSSPTGDSVSGGSSTRSRLPSFNLKT